MNKTYLDKVNTDIIRKNANGICELTGIKTDKLVCDHMHEGESELMGLNSMHDGSIRGCIDTNVNITLGYLMKDAKTYGIDVITYLEMITAYMKKRPTDYIYYNHPRDVFDSFKKLNEEDKIEYLLYNFGVETSAIDHASLDILCNATIKEAYNMPKRLKL